MSIESAPTAVPARTAVALSPALRQHRMEVARAALAAGRPLNLDAITVILATKQLESANDGTPFTRWTTRQVVAFLWGTVLEWCVARGIEAPSNVGETLWTYLTHLADEGELASGSSSLAALREALVENAGVNRSGRSSHPAGSRVQATVHRLSR